MRDTTITATDLPSTRIGTTSSDSSAATTSMIFAACWWVRELRITRERPSSIARPAAPTPGAHAPEPEDSAAVDWPRPHCTSGATRLSPSAGRYTRQASNWSTDLSESTIAQPTSMSDSAVSSGTRPASEYSSCAPPSTAAAATATSSPAWSSPAVKLCDPAAEPTSTANRRPLRRTGTASSVCSPSCHCSGRSVAPETAVCTLWRRMQRR